jgi:hypothetical protein
MRRIGNLFELARKELDRKVAIELINDFTMVDVINLAVLFRMGLDNNPSKFYKKYNIKLIKLTKEELKINHRISVKNSELKKRKGK